MTTPPQSRQERIRFKQRPDGSIRAYDAVKKSNISELQIWTPYNIAPTLLAEGCTPNVILCAPLPTDAPTP